MVDAMVLSAQWVTVALAVAVVLALVGGVFRG